MIQYGFSFDASLCSGCMACTVACQDQQNTSADEYVVFRDASKYEAGNDEVVAFRHVTRYEQGRYPDARIGYFSLSCQHCGDAPCVIVCPTRALYRDQGDGSVLVDRDLCVGCHSCELACPFGAPKFPEDGKMTKCDLCHTRRDHGLKPACVRICPTQALDVGPLDELSKRKAEKASVVIMRSLAIGFGGDR